MLALCTFVTFEPNLGPFGTYCAVHEASADNSLCCGAYLNHWRKIFLKPATRGSPWAMGGPVGTNFNFKMKGTGWKIVGWTTSESTRVQSLFGCLDSCGYQLSLWNCQREIFSSIPLPWKKESIWFYLYKSMASLKIAQCANIFHTI